MPCHLSSHLRTWAQSQHLRNYAAWAPRCEQGAANEAVAIEAKVCLRLNPDFKPMPKTQRPMPQKPIPNSPSFPNPTSASRTPFPLQTPARLNPSTSRLISHQLPPPPSLVWPPAWPGWTASSAGRSCGSPRSAGAGPAAAAGTPRPLKASGARPAGVGMARHRQRSQRVAELRSSNELKGSFMVAPKSHPAFCTGQF